MIGVFIQSFSTLFYAIAQVFLVMGIAAFLIRKRFISSEIISALSQMVVLVLLPCLSFDKILTGFHPEQNSVWWAVPLLGVGMVLVGMMASRALFGKAPEQRYLWALSSLQNCTFFVLPIGKIIYPDQFDQFSLYVFLMALLVNPILWSLGKVLITNTAELHWKKFITPPFIANIAALFLVFTGLRDYFPAVILGPISMLGNAAVPLATFILGATLGTAAFKGLPSPSIVLRYLSIKFLLLPLLVFLGIYFLKLRQSSPLLADFLMIEACAAPATALIIQTRRYGGDESRVGSLMLLGYCLCLIILPLWLALSSLV